MSKRTRDAEELRHRKLVRQRFRNLIKSVALNRIWLVDAGNQKLSLNAKNNIALLVRTQRKIGLLTLAEKSLIRTHHSLRTADERKTLVSLLANLTCFSKIPPVRPLIVHVCYVVCANRIEEHILFGKVRARLAQCVKFMIVTPGRKLIKEGNAPLMIYFLLSGEVEISKQIFNPVSISFSKIISLLKHILASSQNSGDIVLNDKVV